jgi:predicted PurR-regulated permease PerM
MVLATLVITAVVGAFYVIYALGALWLVIFLGIVLATALAPVVDAAAARGVPRALAGTVVMGVLGGGVAAVLFLVVPAAVNELQALAAFVPQVCTRLRGWSGTLGPGMWSETARRLVESVCSLSENPAELRPVLGPSWHYIGTLQEGAWILVAVTAIGYFWARDRQALVRAWLHALPAGQRESARSFFDEAEKRLGGFVRGQFLLAASVGLLAAVAYRLIGLPHAWTLGLFAAIAEPLPIIGPLVAALWAASDGLLVDASLVWKVALIAVALRITADYVLMPAIMGRSSHTNSFLLLVTVVAMASLGGIVGAMVAVPLAALVQLALERALREGQALDTVTLARDRLGVLRYRALQIGEAARKEALPRARRQGGKTAGTGATLEDEIEGLAQDMRSWLEESPEVRGDRWERAS